MSSRPRPEATVNDILEMREALRPYLVPFGASMTTRDIIENATALVKAARENGTPAPPFVLILPTGTNLLELVGEGEEQKTLIDTLLAIEGVQDVKVSKDSKGLSIETL